MNKLKSRKFWVAVLSAATIAAGDQLGIDLTPEKVVSLAGLASVYVFGQAQIDKQTPVKPVVPKPPPPEPDANTVLHQG